MPRAPKQPETTLAALRRAARPLAGNEDDERAVLDWIGHASIVLLGEATHGTHDFYAARARITQRLIVERDFSAVAIEGDWPDAARVNRYVRHGDGAPNAFEALAGFRRFPAWMWRNFVVAEFVAWLRHRNGVASTPENRVSFHGLDLYSLHASMSAVIEHLDRVDPVAARSARHSYACFDQFGPDTESYAWAAARLGSGETCEDAVVHQLLALRRKRDELRLRGEGRQADDLFEAEQNARLVANAERYYRTMMRGRVESWNLRDRHMAETLTELLAHLRRRGRPPKIVVWAHNSHLGDARATAMGDEGELNLGQLVREQHGDDARLIGFTTYEGTVTAAADWGEAAQTMDVRPALEGSYERLFHDLGLSAFFLRLAPGSDASAALAERRLERAIGVIYKPETERWSHYFEAALPSQFDAILHFDRTRALQPLEPSAREQPGEEVPETFPSGV